MHRLFDPVIARSARLGAGLDWKTSLQELTAAGILGVPEYHVEESGPDHQKSFRASVRIGGRPYGEGEGQLQEGSRAASRRGGLDVDQRRAGRLGRRFRPARAPGQPRATAARTGAELVPELPEVETVRRGLQRHLPGRVVESVQVLHPRAVRRHAAGADDFAAATDRAPHRRGPAARQIPVAPGRRGRAAGSPRDERPAAGRRSRPRRSRRMCGPGSPFAMVALTCASLTSGRSVISPSRPAGPSCPPAIAHIAPDPLEPGFDLARPDRAAPLASHRDQAGPARSVADQRRRQHLRRRGAVAGAAALGPRHGPDCGAARSQA